MFPIAALMAAISLWSGVVPQAVSPQGDSAPNLTLIRWVTPVYPATAIANGVAGDVNLKVSVRPDGTVESVTVITGADPLLIQAAGDSAKQSRFACRQCSGLIERSLIYTFQLAKPDPCCCSSGHQRPNDPEVSHVGDHMTITASPLCVCPDACAMAWAKAHSKYRSVKCLYLWKCGTRRIGIV